MTLVIVRQGEAPYVAGMPAVLLRLAMLIALAFVPFGMANAPAVAAVGSAAVSGHCDEHQKPAGAPAKMEMHCATCAALPASESVEVDELKPMALVTSPVISALSNTEPEIATPPPKLS